MPMDKIDLPDQFFVREDESADEHFYEVARIIEKYSPLPQNSWI